MKWSASSFAEENSPAAAGDALRRAFDELHRRLLMECYPASDSYRAPAAWLTVTVEWERA